MNFKNKVKNLIEPKYIPILLSVLTFVPGSLVVFTAYIVGKTIYNKYKK